MSLERMEIKCCMVGCDNVYSGNETVKRSFFAFPKDFNQCMMWVQNSGHAEYFEDFVFAGAQPFVNRHICSDHFNDVDFVKKDPRMGLLPGSKPNLNLFFQTVDVKVENSDSEYAVNRLSKSVVPEPEVEIKLEKTENSFDELNSSFSFSSTDESCTELPAFGTVDVYKETEADKELSNEFFKNYKKAIRGRDNSRFHEIESERALRLKKEALRAKIRRSQESEEETKLRRMKNALRAAFRRQNETPQQRDLRKKKDRLRSRRRRRTETEAETRIRRYNDAVRAAFRRNNETEEQRMKRKMKDILRAAQRRSLETPEQRQERLRKDRERASKKRMLKKITEQMIRIHNDPHPPTTTLNAVPFQCNESSITPFQQVLEFIESNTRKTHQLVERHRVSDTAQQTSSNSESYRDKRTLDSIPGETSQAKIMQHISESATSAPCDNISVLQPELVWS